MLEIGGGSDLGLDTLQVRQRLVKDLQLSLRSRGRLGWCADNCHLLFLQHAEGLRRVAAWRAGAWCAA